jgi:hypothetical protein
VDESNEYPWKVQLDLAHSFLILRQNRTGMSITTKELLETSRKITQESIDLVEKKVSSLTENQLNWRPNPGVWSVNEILAHLNSYATYYYELFDLKITRTKFRNSKDEFTSSPLGRSAWSSMKLGNAKNIKRKFKAPKAHNPSIDASLMHADEAARFIKRQRDLLLIIDRAAEVNLKKVRIPISISKMVRLRLGDALLFVSYHTERHMQQLLNLEKSSNFPRK